MLNALLSPSQNLGVFCVLRFAMLKISIMFKVNDYTSLAGGMMPLSGEISVGFMCVTSEVYLFSNGDSN